MKKLVLTLVILLAFAFNGMAQQGSFAPQGAEWYFNVASFMGSPTTYFRYWTIRLSKATPVASSRRSMGVAMATNSLSVKTTAWCIGITRLFKILRHYMTSMLRQVNRGIATSIPALLSVRCSLLKRLLWKAVLIVFKPLYP